LKSAVALALITLCAAGVAVAQETPAAVPPSHQPSPTPPPPAHVDTGNAPKVFTSEVRLQWLAFGNFFEAGQGQPGENVDAVGAAYRGFYHGWRRADLYGEVNTMKFTSIDRKRPFGLRAGARHEDEQQSFDVFLDRGLNRQAFDVGDRTAIATITTLSGEYARKVGRKWEVGGEAMREQQRFDVQTTSKNDYTRAGVSLRFRGFGYKFSPRVGYDLGQRSVENRVDTYDERYWYVQVTSLPVSRIYLSLAYRAGQRTYTDNPDPLAHHVSRPQWTGFASYKLTHNLNAAVYYSKDVSRSPLLYRRFQTSFLLFGLTARL
jgi:hypothetical protein